MGKVLRSALTSEREVVEPFAMSAEDVFPLNTAPKDKRVPQSNQVKACYMYYNSYHQCKYDFSEDEPQCAKLKHWSMAMCPYEWVEKWDAQREAGTYAGPVPGETSGGH